MTKRKSKTDEMVEMCTAFWVSKGYTKCEKCSTPNWTIYHAPGEPCDKVNAEMLDKIGTKAVMFDKMIDETKVHKG